MARAQTEQTGFAASVVVMAALGLLLAPGVARASGYGLNENSARVMGMAGAFTAVADSPAAIYYNPAGIAQLDGLQIEAGLTLIAPSATYLGKSPDGRYDVEVGAVEHLFPVPSVLATFRVHEMVSVGVGLYVPYGLTMEWPATAQVNGKDVGWWGRGLVRKVSLETVYVNPTVGVQLHDRLFLGVGFTVAAAAVTLERSVTLSADPAADVDFKMSGDDVAFGATAGLLVKVIPELLNVGLSFRSGVAFAFEGAAAFTQSGSSEAVPASLRSKLTDGAGAAELTTPHVVSIGAAAFPSRRLTVSLNLDVITWSSYDRLRIEFADNDELTTSEVKDWHNTMAVRLGAEYHVLSWLPVRIGFVFDQSPVPETTLSPDLPDGDRYIFNLGVGYRWRGLSVDLAYMYLATGEVPTAKSNALVGTYEASAHLLGLSLGYKLDI